MCSRRDGVRNRENDTHCHPLPLARCHEKCSVQLIHALAHARNPNSLSRICHDTSPSCIRHSLALVSNFQNQVLVLVRKPYRGDLALRVAMDI